MCTCIFYVFVQRAIMRCGIFVLMRLHVYMAPLNHMPARVHGASQSCACTCTWRLSIMRLHVYMAPLNHMPAAVASDF
jgi:hypothetical protein